LSSAPLLKSVIALHVAAPSNDAISWMWISVNPVMGRANRMWMFCEVSTEIDGSV
jgi:hypothetical protein